MILDRIITQKKVELELSNSPKHLAFLKSNCQKSKRNFKARIEKGNAFILECKKASPSKGLLRATYNLDDICNAYTPFASAISVLTDSAFFKGSFDHLKQVRNYVEQPILCKDFFISEFQVYLARYAGADAILLMLSVLNDADYLRLRELAQSLGMDCISEVHTVEELARASALSADIIGINNRNLHTLEIDLHTTDRLLPFVPNNAVVIAESGFSSHEQIRSYQDNVHAFLVGSSLMQAERLDLAIRELIFGKVKICGLRNESDCQAAYNSGAIYGGLIFVEQSPRFVDPQKTKPIQTNLLLVGVFQNAAPEHIVTVVKKFGLAVVQLHGEETAANIQALRELLDKDVHIWKAVSAYEPIKAHNAIVDAILFDTKTESAFGGSGKTFNWEAIPNCQVPIVLAGGISAENIREAQETAAEILDVNSLVENSKGEKEPQKIQALFQEIRFGGQHVVLR